MVNQQYRSQPTRAPVGRQRAHVTLNCAVAINRLLNYIYLYMHVGGTRHAMIESVNRQRSPCVAKRRRKTVPTVTIKDTVTIRRS